MTGILVGALVLLVAFANGANDNFKGVATLHGSGTASYLVALRWATATTFVGSLCALLLSDQLLQAFSGAGLAEPTLARSPHFLIAAAVGTASTVLAATWLALPVSTTHALLGALVGAGLALQSRVTLMPVVRGVVLPLLGAPLVSLLVTAGVYAVFRRARRHLAVGPATPVTVGIAVAQRQTDSGSSMVVSAQATGLRLVAVSARQVLATAHFTSAAALSFARGLNDTPKIAALMLASGIAARGTAIVAVGLAMAVGALVAARRVAATMSTGITPMNDGQGFSANAVAAALLIGASLSGVPASMTHLSCGALFGLGAVTAEARWRTVAHIAWAWVVTLPVAALLSAAAAATFRRLCLP